MEIRERSDALNALQRLADIATEGARICDGMMGKGSASVGAELMASHRDANVNGAAFWFKRFHDMERFMQAARHGVPVHNID